jgi:hypothetical protein
MAHSKDIARIQRVNGVRKVRLSRALSAAQREAEAADAARERARIEAVRKTEAFVAARLDMARNPGCPQTRLWRDRATEQREEAAVASLSAIEVADEAKVAVLGHVRAVRNHELRTTKIEDHRKMLRRQEGRLTEMLGEDDLLPSRGGSVHE